LRVRFALFGIVGPVSLVLALVWEQAPAFAVTTAVLPLPGVIHAIRVPHDTMPVRVFVLPISWLGLELGLGLELELDLGFKLGLGLGLELEFELCYG
jgi:hypothetical protein